MVVAVSLMLMLMMMMMMMMMVMVMVMVMMMVMMVMLVLVLVLVMLVLVLVLMLTLTMTTQVIVPALRHGKKNETLQLLTLVKLLNGGGVASKSHGHLQSLGRNVAHRSLPHVTKVQTCAFQHTVVETWQKLVPRKEKICFFQRMFPKLP